MGSNHFFLFGVLVNLHCTSSSCPYWFCLPPVSVYDRSHRSYRFTDHLHAHSYNNRDLNSLTVSTLAPISPRDTAITPYHRPSCLFTYTFLQLHSLKKLILPLRLTTPVPVFYSPRELRFDGIRSCPFHCWLHTFHLVNLREINVMNSGSHFNLGTNSHY